MPSDFHCFVFSGDPPSNRPSDGTKNEPVALEPPQHAEGGAADEQIVPSKHPQPDGSMRPRRPTPRSHRVHQRRLLGAARPKQERGFAPADEGLASQGHFLRDELPSFQGRLSQGLNK